MEIFYNMNGERWKFSLNCLINHKFLFAVKGVLLTKAILWIVKLKQLHYIFGGETCPNMCSGYAVGFIRIVSPKIHTTVEKLGIW